MMAGKVIVYFFGLICTSRVSVTLGQILMFPRQDNASGIPNPQMCVDGRGICDPTLGFANGSEIKSPCWPDPYPNDVSCTLTLYPETARFIQLNISYFAMEMWQDYLKLEGPWQFIVFVDNNNTQSFIVTLYSNESSVPENLTSQVISDKTNNDKGFEISATSVSATTLLRQLSGVEKSERFVLPSPLYLSGNFDGELTNMHSFTIPDGNVSKAWKDYVDSVSKSDAFKPIYTTDNGFSIDLTGVAASTGGNYTVSISDMEGNKQQFNEQNGVILASGLRANEEYDVEYVFFNKNGDRLTSHRKVTTAPKVCTALGVETRKDRGQTEECKCQNGLHGDPKAGCLRHCGQTTREWNNETLNFDETVAGTKAYSAEKCGGYNTGRANASMDCNIHGEWEEFVYAARFCSIPMDEIIRKVTVPEDASADDLKNITDELQLATSGETAPWTSVTRIADCMVNVSKIIDTAEANISVYQNAVNIVNNLIMSNSFTTNLSLQYNATAVKRQLLTSLTNISQFIELPYNSTIPIKINSEKVVSEIQRVSAETESTFEPVLVEETYDYQSKNKSQDQSKSDTYRPLVVAVPSSAIGSNKRISFILYLTKDLFPAENAATPGLIVGVHIGQASKRIADFGGHVNITYLPAVVASKEKQHDNFTYNSTFTGNITSNKCGYWNNQSDKWSFDGCFMAECNENRTVCLCNHLTNFAKLVIQADGLKLNIALNTVSVVGLSLSILGLLLTITIHAVREDVRKRRPTQILFHICATIIICNVVFVFGIDKKNHRGGCTAIAATMQYFFLASFTWMTIYAFDMYRAFVLVFRSGRSHYMMRCALFGYGLPLLITALNVGLTVGYLDPRNESTDGCNQMRNHSHYVQDNVCWLYKYSLYVGFLAPVALMIIFNVYVYIAVIRVLFKRNKSVNSTATDTSPKEYLLISFTLLSSTGAFWVVGYVMLVCESQACLTTLNWIFVVVNTLQGFLIFLCTCVRHESMRNIWLQPLLRCFKVEGSPKRLLSSSNDKSQYSSKSNEASTGGYSTKESEM